MIGALAWVVALGAVGLLYGEYVWPHWATRIYFEHGGYRYMGIWSRQDPERWRIQRVDIKDWNEITCPAAPRAEPRRETIRRLQRAIDHQWGRAA